MSQDKTPMSEQQRRCERCISYGDAVLEVGSMMPHDGLELCVFVFERGLGGAGAHAMSAFIRNRGELEVLRTCLASLVVEVDKALAEDAPGKAARPVARNPVNDH
jgi:hypothetical protein